MPAVASTRRGQGQQRERKAAYHSPQSIATATVVVPVIGRLGYSFYACLCILHELFCDPGVSLFPRFPVKPCPESRLSWLAEL